MKTKPPEKSWDIFFEVVTKAGLTAECVHVSHWQIRGGIDNELVHCWAHTVRGFEYGTSQRKTNIGTVADAIELAGAP